jgi:extracellular factor (EF) 3-hydroxypalmitic acid methyl ester biosynthesis protein
LVLCSPFACRTYTKPLGYAGDYEMVNMILRDGWEGDSLYARIVNTWFLRQPPAVAHRNRISYLADRLAEETLRVQRAGRKARVFNLACGPAHETQRFIRDSVVSNFTDFTMLDFNLETLQHLEAALTAAQAQSGRRTSVAYVQKSVHQLFKEAGRGQRLSNAPRYDFVYCAGLFDYLTDEVCRRLMEIMYDWVSPGGLVVATNVDPSNPLRNGMEHLLDWHLSYRSSAEFSRLVPRQADPDDARVITEATGTNLFLEVRKPLHG